MNLDGLKFISKHRISKLHRIKNFVGTNNRQNNGLPKDIHIQISLACECFALHDKKGFYRCNKLRSVWIT